MPSFDFNRSDLEWSDESAVFGLARVCTDRDQEVTEVAIEIDTKARVGVLPFISDVGSVIGFGAFRAHMLAEGAHVPPASADSEPARRAALFVPVTAGN